MAHLRKKNGSWHVYWREGGRQRSRRIGTRKSDAEEFRAEIELRIKRKEILGVSTEKRVHFERFCELYLATRGPSLAPSTRAHTDLTIRVHLAPLFAKHLLQQITQEEIETYRADRLKDGAKPSTVNRELDVFKAILARAVEWGYLRSSPADGVRKLKLPLRPPPAWLTSERCHRLLDAAQGHVLTFCALGCLAGLRKGEIFGLRWSDVDLDGRRLTVWPDRSKSNEFRMIPLNADLHAILSTHPRHITSKFILHGRNGEPLKDIRTAFHSALAAATLPRIRPHDLRHSFISNLVAAGVDLRTVMEMTGHRNLSTLQRYAHLAPGRNVDAVGKLSRTQNQTNGEQGAVDTLTKKGSAEKKPAGKKRA
jgi:integrase